MKPSRLALATIVTSVLGVPALALAQPVPDEGEPDPGDEATMPEPPQGDLPPPPPPPKADFRFDGGFQFTSADEAFELKLGIRSQFRFDALRADAGDDSELNARFLVPRLRLQLEGHAYSPKTAYKVELDMANRGYSLLKDFFVDQALSEALHVRAGQWKRPFHRQEIVSDFGSEFVERSLANELAGAGRDLGVALHNDYEKSPDGVEWALGVFNAGSDRAALTTTCVPGMLPTDPPKCTTGVPTNVPRDFGPALVAHVGFNHGKIKGYSEGDLEGGPLRFAVAASYRLNPRDLDRDDDDNLQLEHAVSLDAMIKVEGLGLTGALVLIKDPDDPEDDLETGFYGQAGYMLLPKKLLGAVRFAQIPDGAEKRMEILGGVNWFWKGHKAKWMIDGGVIRTTGDEATNDLQIRTQLQFVL